MIIRKASIRRAISGGLCAVFFVANGVLAHSAETNFWKHRHAALELAALPVTPPRDLSALSRLPSRASLAARHASPHSVGADGGPHDAVFGALSLRHGSIRNVSPTAGRPERLLIHIQDVHHNLEAQANIAAAVESLIAGGQVDLIALEGAFDAIPIPSYRRAADNASVGRVTDYLFRTHRLSGPIRAALTSGGNPPAVVGIDDRAAYDAHVEAVKRAYQRKAAASRRLAEAEALERGKAAGLNPALRAFDQAVAAFHAGAAGLGAYAKSLAAQDDGTPASIATFLSALRIEESIDFAQVESERARLLRRLVEVLDPREIAGLSEAGQAFRSGAAGHAAFYRRLRNLCAANGVHPAGYPTVFRYFDYVRLSDAVDGDRLMRDLAEREASAYDRLARRPEEKAWIERSRLLRLSRKLADFSLTAREWAAYDALAKGAAAGLDAPARAAFEDFYRQAAIRDERMAGRLAAEIERRDARVTVLVTGGFHTAGLHARLNDPSTTVVTWTPRLTRVDANAGSAYLSVFAQEKTPLDRLFQGEKLFLATAPIVSLSSFRKLAALSAMPAIAASRRFGRQVWHMTSNPATREIVKVWVTPAIAATAAFLAYAWDWSPVFWVAGWSAIVFFLLNRVIDRVASSARISWRLYAVTLAGVFEREEARAAGFAEGHPLEAIAARHGFTPDRVRAQLLRNQALLVSAFRTMDVVLPASMVIAAVLSAPVPLGWLTVLVALAGSAAVSRLLADEFFNPLFHDVLNAVLIPTGGVPLSKNASPGDADPDEKAGSPAEFDLDDQPLSGVSVLYLEDQDHLRRAVVGELEGEGAIVEAVEHGAEGLERIRSGVRYDLIVCDVDMPVMDGFTFYHRLRESDPELADRVVFLTARNEVDVQGATDGAALYLSKPTFRIDDLLRLYVEKIRPLAAAAPAPSEGRSVPPPTKSDASETPPAEGENGPLSGVRILYLEDNDGMREIITTHLTDKGARVDAHMEGGSALQSLRDAASYDLILTDMDMPPGMDGAEFYRNLAAEFPDDVDRVIFLTGQSEKAVADRIGRDVPYVSKTGLSPGSLVRLLAEKSEAIGGKEAGGSADPAGALRTWKKIGVVNPRAIGFAEGFLINAVYLMGRSLLLGYGPPGLAASGWLFHLVYTALFLLPLFPILYYAHLKLGLFATDGTELENPTPAQAGVATTKAALALLAVPLSFFVPWLDPIIVGGLIHAALNLPAGSRARGRLDDGDAAEIPFDERLRGIIADEWIPKLKPWQKMTALEAVPTMTRGRAVILARNLAILFGLSYAAMRVAILWIPGLPSPLAGTLLASAGIFASLVLHEIGHIVPSVVREIFARDGRGRFYRRITINLLPQEKAYLAWAYSFPAHELSVDPRERSWEFKGGPYASLAAGVIGMIAAFAVVSPSARLFFFAFSLWGFLAFFALYLTAEFFLAMAAGMLGLSLWSVGRGFASGSRLWPWAPFGVIVASLGAAVYFFRNRLESPADGAVTWRIHRFTRLLEEVRGLYGIGAVDAIDVPGADSFYFRSGDGVFWIYYGVDDVTSEEDGGTGRFGEDLYFAESIGRVPVPFYLRGELLHTLDGRSVVEKRGRKVAIYRVLNFPKKLLREGNEEERAPSAAIDRFRHAVIGKPVFHPRKGRKRPLSLRQAWGIDLGSPERNRAYDEGYGPMLETLAFWGPTTVAFLWGDLHLIMVGMMVSLLLFPSLHYLGSGDDRTPPDDIFETAFNWTAAQIIMIQAFGLMGLPIPVAAGLALMAIERFHWGHNRSDDDPPSGGVRRERKPARAVAVARRSVPDDAERIDASLRARPVNLGVGRAVRRASDAGDGGALGREARALRVDAAPAANAARDDEGDEDDEDDEDDEADEADGDEGEDMDPTEHLLSMEVNYGFLPASHAWLKLIHRRINVLLPGLNVQGWPRIRVLATRGEGVNAWALPEGTIVITPEVLESLEYEEELDALLLHEINHWIRKHRALIRRSGRFGNLTKVIGAERFSEMEADIAAFFQMAEKHRRTNPKAMISLLEKFRGLEGKSRPGENWDFAHGDVSNRILNLKELSLLQTLMNFDRPMKRISASIRRAVPKEEGRKVYRFVRRPPTIGHQYDRWMNDVVRLLRDAEPAFLHAVMGGFFEKLVDVENAVGRRAAAGAPPSRRQAEEREQILNVLNLSHVRWEGMVGGLFESDAETADAKAILLEVAAGVPVITDPYQPAIRSLRRYQFRAAFAKNLRSPADADRFLSTLERIPYELDRDRVFRMSAAVLSILLNDNAVFDRADGSVDTAAYFRFAASFLARVESILVDNGFTPSRKKIWDLTAAWNHVVAGAAAALAELGQWREASSTFVASAEAGAGGHPRLLMFVDVLDERIRALDGIDGKDRTAGQKAVFRAYKSVRNRIGSSNRAEVIARLNEVRDELKSIPIGTIDARDPAHRALLVEAADLFDQLPEVVSESELRAILGRTPAAAADKEWTVSRAEVVEGFAEGIFFLRKKRDSQVPRTKAAALTAIRWYQLVARDESEYERFLGIVAEWHNEGYRDLRYVSSFRDAEEIVASLTDPKKVRSMFGRDSRLGPIESKPEGAIAWRRFLLAGLAAEITGTEALNAARFFRPLERFVRSTTVPRRTADVLEIDDMRNAVLARGLSLLNLEKRLDKTTARRLLTLSFFMADPALKRRLQSHLLTELLGWRKGRKAVPIKEAVDLVLYRYAPQGMLGGLSILEEIDERARSKEDLAAIEAGIETFISSARGDAGGLGAGVLAEGLYLALGGSIDKSPVVNALLVSGVNEQPLRDLLAEAWWDGYGSAIKGFFYDRREFSLADLEDEHLFLGFLSAGKSDDEEGGAHISAQGLLDGIYRLGPVQRLAALRLLLVGPAGALRTPAGRHSVLETFLSNYVSSSESRDRSTMNVVEKVFEAVLNSAPEDELYLILSRLIRDRIGQSPVESGTWTAKAREFAEDAFSWVLGDDAIDAAEKKIEDDIIKVEGMLAGLVIVEESAFGVLTSHLNRLRPDSVSEELMAVLHDLFLREMDNFEKDDESEREGPAWNVGWEDVKRIVSEAYNRKSAPTRDELAAYSEETRQAILTAWAWFGAMKPASLEDEWLLFIKDIYVSRPSEMDERTADVWKNVSRAIRYIVSNGLIPFVAERGYRLGELEDALDISESVFRRGGPDFKAYVERRSKPFIDLYERKILEAMDSADEAGVDEEALVASIVPPEMEQSDTELFTPLGLIIQSARQLGAPGVRFLQLLGKAIDLPERYQVEFLTVYDSLKGQSLSAANKLIKEEMPDYWEEIEAYEGRVGGGSLFTVYVVRLKDGTREIVRVLNPQARHHADVYLNVMNKALADLVKNAETDEEKRRFERARPLLGVLRGWIMNELSETTFDEDDQRFRDRWNGERPFGDKGPSIVVPTTVPTGSPFIRREELIGGRNFTALDDYALSDRQTLVAAAIRHYFGQLMDGEVNLIHSDISPGNLRIDDDGNLAILDRGMYLKLDDAERGLMATLTMTSDTAARATAFVDWLWTLKENKKFVKKLKKEEVIQAIVDHAADDAEKSGLDLLRVVNGFGLSVTLNVTLLFKNINVFDKLAAEVGLGSLREAFLYVPPSDGFKGPFVRTATALLITVGLSLAFPSWAPAGAAFMFMPLSPFGWSFERRSAAATEIIDERLRGRPMSRQVDHHLGVSFAEQEAEVLDRSRAERTERLRDLMKGDPRAVDLDAERRATRVTRTNS